MATAPRPTALVTGASEGIGLEIARCLAAGGYDLVLVARRARELADLGAELAAAHGVTALPLPCDLAEPGAAGRLFAETADRGLVVEALVNSAGFGMHGPFVEADPGEQRAMVQVNAAALTELCRLCLPGMVERGRGRILNVASTAAFQPGPWMAAYHATKAFVLYLSLALNEELAGTGVTVTALCPGPTRSGFQARAGVEGTRIVRQGMMTAAEVAAIGYRAMQRGQPLVIPGHRNTLLAWLTRLFPYHTTTRLAGRLLADPAPSPPGRGLR